MPELPEVETVCRYLEASIRGEVFKSAALSGKKFRVESGIDIIATLPGYRVEGVQRRAKYCLIKLTGGLTLVLHLGMSGKATVLDSYHRPEKHDHAIMQFESGKLLVFNDARRFGLLVLMNSAEVSSSKLLSELGVEPLSSDFSSEYLYEKLRARSQNIKTTIMDQSLVVGVGNIYASEALFKSRISPLKPANEITAANCKLLVQNIKEVLEAAIKSGGSTLRDYVRPDGVAGYFQHHFDVYGKEGKPCPKCGGKIKKIVQNARSTFFCGKCQK